jgi:hypothetical protein
MLLAVIGLAVQSLAAGALTFAVTTLAEWYGSPGSLWFAGSGSLVLLRVGTESRNSRGKDIIQMVAEPDAEPELEVRKDCSLAAWVLKRCYVEKAGE